MSRVSVIIPNWNTRRWLPGCLDSLRQQSYQDFRTILVDSASTDDSLAFVRRRYPEVEIVALPENRGFTGAVNAGIRHSRAEYVALLNVDTEARPAWLASLVDTMDQSPPEIGCLASRMVSMSDPTIIDDAGDTFSWYGSARKRGQGEAICLYQQREEIFSACAGAALYRQSFFDDVGYFDESFTSYLEDIDLSLRGRLLGYRCLFVPEAEVLHHGQGAGLDRGRYVSFMTRNRLAVLLKNIPLPLLIRHSWTLLFGQFYFFLVYKKPLHSLRGYASLAPALPRLLRQRAELQRRKRVSNQALDGMLVRQLGEPRLRDILSGFFK